MTTPTNPSPAFPFSLRIELLDRMLNFEIADDPDYHGLEIQGFDDPEHGRGTLVFLSRREDDRIDVYFERGLRLDPSSYAIGGGLGQWIEMDPGIARLEVSDRGVDAEVRFSDVAGRLIEVRAGDRRRRDVSMTGFLAPMGAAIAEPHSLPLVWMSRFDLLRRSGPAPVIRIDGRKAAPGRLPLEWLLRRRLIKIASDLCIVSLNPTDGTQRANQAEVVLERGGVRSMSARAASHEVHVAFDPTFPDLESGFWGDPQSGGWSLAIDEAPVVAGTWRVAPHPDGAHLALNVTQGWPAAGLPPLMRVVTRVAPVFRAWPTTYQWTGNVIGGDPLQVRGRWERTGDERGGSYRSLTRSA